MADSFLRQAVNMESPGRQFYAITPNDGADIPLRPRALWIGTGGNLTVVDDRGVTTLFSNLNAGWHPIGPVRIMATGTAASGIVGIQ